MPLYEYECAKCGHRFEKIEKVTAATRQKCPRCGAKAERLPSSPAIMFKGSGWYVTDYAGKGGGAKKEAEAAEGKESKDGKEVKEVKEVKETKEVKEVKEAKEAKDKKKPKK